MRRAFRLCGRVMAMGAVMIPLLTWSVAAGADDAVARFERGVQLYEAENFDGALVEFNAAYKATNNFKLLFNMGICLVALKEYAEAWDVFQRYLSDGGNEISASRRADVNDRVQKLSLMVARIRVTSNAPAGASLFVDDRLVGTFPFERDITVKAGRRQVGVVAGDRRVTKFVEVGSGDKNVIVDVPLSDRPASPSHASAARDSNGPAIPWPLWGLTAVLAGGTAITGGLAVSARNDLERSQASYGTTLAGLESDADKARALGIVTDVLLVGTVVSATISTYFTIRSFKKRAPHTGMTILPLGVGFTRSF